ncbi:MAG: TonB-dependent receptor [Sphingobacteriales bacterium JAD_PAG50586_3]|nr:MAG: TonB-dependent receptor [Sphingobacteriales bacterium JAD_PAG50586_3]
MKIKGEYTQMGFLSQQAGGLNDSLFAVDARASFRTRNWLHITWSMPAIDFDYAINDNLSLNVKAFAIFGNRESIGFTGNIGKANGDLNPDNMGARQVDADKYTNYGTEARFMYSYKILGQNHNLAAGLRYYTGKTDRVRYIGTNGSDADFTNVYGDSLQRDFSFETQNLAAFAENVFRIGSKLTVSPGFRFEYLSNSVNEVRPFVYNTSTTRTFPLFGVGAGLATGKSTKLYGNFAQAYRPVLYGDITPAATTDVIDPNLKDAKGYTADLGWRGFIKNWFNFDVSLFYLQYNNRAGRVTITNGNTSYQYVTNLNSSRTLGTEFYAEFNLLKLIRPAKLAGLSVYASGTIQNAEYTDGLINGGTNTEVDMKGKKVEYAPAKVIRAGINYSYKSFSTSLQVAYTDEVFADANNTESSKTGNAGIVPSYTVADWSIGIIVKGHYVIKGGINNLFNQRYFTRRAGGYPGPGILPGDGRNFFVTVGVKF